VWALLEAEEACLLLLELGLGEEALLYQLPEFGQLVGDGRGGGMCPGGLLRHLPLWCVLLGYRGVEMLSEFLERWHLWLAERH
jgi:hypothetical protein